MNVMEYEGRSLFNNTAYMSNFTCHFLKSRGHHKGRDNDWSNVRISIHGVHIMTSQYNGVVDHMKAVSLGAKFIHCYMHKEVLPTKQFPAMLRTVLNEYMKTVDFIKAHPLNLRIFAALYVVMGRMHPKILLHKKSIGFLEGKFSLSYLSYKIKE